MTPQHAFKKIAAMPDTVEITREELKKIADIGFTLFNSDMSDKVRNETARALDAILVSILNRTPSALQEPKE